MPIALILSSGILLGIAYVSGKRLSMEQFSSSAMVLSYSLIGCAVALPLSLYEFGIPSSLLHWSLSIISPILYGISAFFSYKAYKLIDASAVGLVSRINIVVTALLGMMLFNERLQGIALLGLVFVLVGSLLIVYEGTRIKLEKGIIFAILMGVLYGVIVVIDKVVIEEFSPFTYVSYNNLIVAIMFLVATKAKDEIVPLWKKQPLWSIIAAVSGLGSWVLFLAALRIGLVSVLYPVWESIGLVFTVLVSIWYFKESEQLWQKLLGAAITVAGIVLLG